MSKHENHKRGLYQKFTVTRTDGSSEPGSKHANCRYFVLDIDHDEFAIPALKAYEAACRAQYPALADDLRKMRIDAQRFVKEKAVWLRRWWDGR